MPHENTALVVGGEMSTLLIAPSSAFIVAALCTYGCSEAYFAGGVLWSDDVEDAAIFRSFEAAEAAKLAARSATKGCLSEKGVIFDIKPLAGYINS